MTRHHAHPIPRRSIGLARALGDGIAFLFVLGSFAAFFWLVTP